MGTREALSRSVERETVERERERERAAHLASWQSVLAASGKAFFFDQWHDRISTPPVPLSSWLCVCVSGLRGRARLPRCGAPQRSQQYRRPHLEESRKGGLSMH